MISHSNKLTKESPLMTVSQAAQKYWGKEIEDALPKPDLTEGLYFQEPSDFLRDILQYARGAESRGEWLFRHNYLHPILDYLEQSWKTDDMGNVYVQVGETNGVLHVGHIDTVHDDDISPLQKIQVEDEIISLVPEVKHSVAYVAEGERWIAGVKHTHSFMDYKLPKKLKRSLGADDGCAIAIMLYLIINEVPGTYVFTRGEEVGCIGTHYIIDNNLLDWAKYKIAIEVDRKGTNEIITNMAIGDTASDTFGNALARHLDMGHVLGKGTITDVAYMSKFIPECVNISAGYELQHSAKETVNYNYLNDLGDALVLVNWDVLPVERIAGAFNKVNVYTASYVPGKSHVLNSYGDYGNEPTGCKTRFTESVSLANTVQFTRMNANFVAIFLEAMGMSPAEMHEIICKKDDMLLSDK